MLRSARARSAAKRPGRRWMPRRRRCLSGHCAGVRDRGSSKTMQQEPEDELEQRPARPVRPTVPSDVLREVTQLSQPPAPGADAYVLAPPPAWSPEQQPTPAHDRLLAAIAHAAIIFGFLGIGFLVSLGINLGLWLYSRHSP